MAATSKGCTAGPRVLRVLDRGRVIIDASELRRVIIRDTSEVLAELLPQRDAETFAQTFNDCGGGDAIVVSYQAPKSRKRAASR